MRFLYVQINNDYSGSAYALKAIIKSHSLESFVLMTDFENDGFLSHSNFNNKINVKYNFKGKGIKTIYQLVKYALVSSFKLLKYLFFNEINVFYLNAISPWNSAIIGKIFSKKVVYHVHEYYFSPSLHIKFYIWIMIKTSSEIIFVSEFTKTKYLENYPELKKIKHSVQFTPVQFKTIELCDINIVNKFNGPILLICSPRKYKGIEIFVSLSKKMINRDFKLFLNDNYYFDSKLPDNLEVRIKDKNIETALRNASICLNLSQKPDWIETFGLTIWESLTQGTPVVVPDIGGPLEIIDDTCGISCDTRNINSIILSINKIISDIDIYTEFSKSSIKRSLFLQNMNNIPKQN